MFANALISGMMLRLSLYGGTALIDKAINEL
jgi:hypothetical protein